MKYVYITIAILLAAVVAFAALNKVSPLGWGWWGSIDTKSGVALGGFDPVSYHQDSGPQEGSKALTYDWHGAEWRFASEANRKRFESGPEQYAPRFGGYCSFAVSKGFTARASPEAWYVEDGALYLFADKNVRDQWVAEIPDGVMQTSRENWAKR